MAIVCLLLAVLALAINLWTKRTIRKTLRIMDSRITVAEETMNRLSARQAKLAGDQAETEGTLKAWMARRRPGFPDLPYRNRLN